MTRLLVVNHAADLGGAELTLLDLLGQRPPGIEVTLALATDGMLAAAARERGASVLVLSPGNSVLAYRRRAPNFTPLHTMRAITGLTLCTTRLARLARRHDIVVTNSTKAHLYGGLAARLAARPCVWRLHDVIDEKGFSRLARMLFLLAARELANRVLPVSNAVAAPLLAAGVRDVRVRPNGVDLEHLHPPDGARARVREELGIPSEAPLILMLARLTPQKGAEVLIDALARLPGVHAILAGDSTFSEVAGYPEQLHARAAPIADRVHLIGFREDVPALLASADVLAHPAVRPDSLPGAVLEALGAGVPVVATASGGAEEILAGEAGGLLVPPGETAPLASALNRILVDRDLAHRLRLAALQRAQDYALEGAYAAVWNSILSEGEP